MLSVFHISLVLATVVFMLARGGYSWPTFLALVEVLWGVVAASLAIKASLLASPGYLAVSSLALALGAGELAILIILFYLA